MEQTIWWKVKLSLGASQLEKIEGDIPGWDKVWRQINIILTENSIFMKFSHFQEVNGVFWTYHLNLFETFPLDYS